MAVGPRPAGRLRCRWGQQERCKAGPGQAPGKALPAPQPCKAAPAEGWPGHSQPASMIAQPRPLHWQVMCRPQTSSGLWAVPWREDGCAPHRWNCCPEGKVLPLLLCLAVGETTCSLVSLSLSAATALSWSSSSSRCSRSSFRRASQASESAEVAHRFAHR